ncbi:MAG: DUF4399 domain-containing protein [Myxococcales bacterium]
MKRRTCSFFTDSSAHLSIAVVAALVFVPAFVSANVPMPGDVTAAPNEASLEIISPANGDTVTSPVTVKFGLAGMGVAPAGIEAKNTGHHHLIIDSPLPNVQFAIPKDTKHRHFGGGQTQVTLELEPGTHTLQLLLGDYRHIPHEPAVVSEKITITVK